MKRWFRLLLILGLLAANGLLMADYAANADAHQPYPALGDIAADPQHHLGEHVYSWVRVRTITADGFTIGNGDRQLTVVSDQPVEPGDSAQVYGVVNPDRRIVAERVVVSPRPNRYYMFAASAGSVLLTLVLFFRRWTVDRHRFVVRPRRRRRDG